MEFTPLERDVLDWIAHHSGLPAIEDQIRVVVPTSRKFTGVGSYTELLVRAEVAPVNVRTAPRGPQIKSSDLDEAGGGSVLYFNKGLAVLLELYSHGDKFPESLSSWTLQ
jgi:hypothetical protein